MSSSLCNKLFKNVQEIREALSRKYFMVWLQMMSIYYFLNHKKVGGIQIHTHTRLHEMNVKMRITIGLFKITEQNGLKVHTDRKISKN